MANQNVPRSRRAAAVVAKPARWNLVRFVAQHYVTTKAGQEADKQ